MRGWTRWWLAIGLGVAGCGGGGGGGDLPCGAAICDTATDACCVLPDPGNDVCFALDGGSCIGGHLVACDGSEDCPGGTVCCYEFGNTACLEAPACAAQGGHAMCHDGDTEPCQTGESCCLLPGADSPYAVCATGC